MKLLAFSDMHGSLKAFGKLKAGAKKADCLVCAGDISIFENRLRPLLHKFNSLGKPMVIIAGNHESDKALSKESRHLANIRHANNEIITFGKFHFICASGNGFSIQDRNLEKEAKRLLAKAEELRRKNKDAVFIVLTHAPPYNTALDKIMGGHCGNKAVRRLIEKAKPAIAISGHIHENSGRKDHVNGIRVVNPGPYGTLLDVG